MKNNDKDALIKNADNPLKYGYTLLMVACENGDINWVKSLIENGANVNHKNDCGRTPLMQAAHNGHLPIIKLLLVKGADINTKDERGYSALSLAELISDDTISKYLKTNGAK
jgi:uncharacterized protein